MSEFITSKEQFQKIKQAWSIAVNSPKTKKTLEACDEYKYDVIGTIPEGWEPVQPGSHAYISKGTGRYRQPGWVQAEHHLLYNILRDKPLHTGFSPIKNPNKLNPYISNMHNFYIFILSLKARVEEARLLVKHNNLNKFYKKESGFMDKVMSLATTKVKKKNKDELTPWQVENYTKYTSWILDPFDGTVTLEMLAEVDAEQLKMIMMFDRHNKKNYWLGLKGVR